VLKGLAQGKHLDHTFPKLRTCVGLTVFVANTGHKQVPNRTTGTSIDRPTPMLDLPDKFSR